MAHKFPVYTDYEAARDLKVNACDEGGVVDGWFSQMAALETSRHRVMQAGASLVLAALTWLGLVKMFPGAVPMLPRTPRRTIIYFSLGLAVLGVSWAANVYSFGIDLQRGEFPWCADSIMIPVFGLDYIYGVLTSVSVITGALIAVLFGNLPVELTVWDHERSVISWSVTILSAIPFLLVFAATLDQAMSSSFLAVPAGIVALYIIAATRAALLAGSRPKVL